MRGQPAKVLSEADLRRLMKVAAATPHPPRSQAMILLTVKAGLRACEVAGLTWAMVTKPCGRVAPTIELAAKAAKKGSGRRIPLHPDLRAALHDLEPDRRARVGPVIRSARGGAMTAKSIVNWFTWACREASLDGCSSHSGRRTFVTRAARLVYRAGGSLRDVQELAGHRSIQTTQGYIDGDADAQRRLIRLL